jgi:hypoxanthine phosphoribosyltransferase
LKPPENQWHGTLKLGWSNIESQVSVLVNKIKKTGFEFDKIATVTRGGLVPARLVADRFDIKVILVDKKKIPQKTLFVDDIYDTGNTFKKILPHVESQKNCVRNSCCTQRNEISKAVSIWSKNQSK